MIDLGQRESGSLGSPATGKKRRRKFAFSEQNLERLQNQVAEEPDWPPGNQFTLRDQLRLPGIIGGGCRGSGGGDQISGDRAHDMVIDTNLNYVFSFRVQFKRPLVRLQVA